MGVYVELIPRRLRAFPTICAVYLAAQFYGWHGFPDVP